MPNQSYWTKQILNLSSIIHALCNSGRFLEAHRRLLLSTVSSSCLPDDRTANVLLSRLLDARTPKLTLVVLNRLLLSKPTFIPSLTIYNRLIAQCHPLDAQPILQQMKSRGRLPNTVSYTTLIDGFSRIGELDTARHVFEEMTKNSVPPNSLTLSALIKGVLRKRRVDEGRELMRELWLKMREEEDISINNAAFANLIGSLCREGFFHEVFRIVEEMPQGRFVNEEFAYGEMMDSLCRAGRNHAASRIVYIMRKRGFVPSLVAYNCIVHGLSAEGGCMRAYQLFKEGIEFGYSPSEPTYKVLVEGLCKEMDFKKAKDVAEFMLQKNDVDKTRIYNIFLSALRLVENPSEQLNVLVLMLQKQCRPDVITLNIVIHGFCKIGKVDEAEKILNDMMKGNFCAPDVVSFTTIIRGLLDVGKVEEALHYFRRRMLEFSSPPNVVTYNTVLGALCKCDRVDEAMEIFDEMEGKGVTADSATYTVIINGLCEMGRLEDAKRFWDDVVWPSMVHDDYVYAAILRGLCHSGKLNEACDFLYELVDCGITPGIVNYNILIDNACKLGLKREAYQIVGEMRKNRLEPDSVTWRILDKLHEKMKEPRIAGDQISEPKWVAEEASKSILLNDGTTSTLLEEKECDSTIERHACPLDGLVDPVISRKLMEDEGIVEGRRVTNKASFAVEVAEEKPKQLECKEPLSMLTRRVFGLI